MNKKKKTSAFVCNDAINYLLQHGTSPIMDRGRAKKVGRIAKLELGIVTDYHRFSKAEGFVRRTYNDIN